MTTTNVTALDSFIADASDRFNGRTAPERAAQAGMPAFPAHLAQPQPPADFAAAKRDGSRGWSAEGAARAERDAAAAAAVGIALKPPVYAMGSLVRGDGVERASQLRAEFEALPVARAAMADLAREVAAERRHDITLKVAEIRMNARGSLVHPSIPADIGGVVGTKNGGAVRVEADAIAKLERAIRTDLGAKRDLGIVGLASCPELVVTAAKVWNDAAAALGAREAAAKPSADGKVPEQNTVVLRTRLSRRADDTGAQHRQVFAVVSESYGECDTNKIAAAVAKMADSDKLRASVHYDRSGVSIDLLTHTTVAPSEFVAGEVYRAGIRITSDDTGGGSITVRAIVERNLCLNIQIVHIGEGATMRIRHLGDPAKVAAKLDEALRASHNAIRHFIAQWDATAREDVAVRLQATKREHVATLADILEDYQAAQDRRELARDILEGTYRGLLEEIGLVGSREVESTTKSLIAAHWDPRNESGIRHDDRVTRGSIVNGLTLWAQDLEPSKAHEVELLAGRITAGEVGLTYSPRPASA